MSLPGGEISLPCHRDGGIDAGTSTSAGVKSWKGVETTSALQARSHGDAVPAGTQVFFGLRANTTGEHVVVHLKKAADAEGRRPLFLAHDEVLSRRVHTKSKKHSVPAGTTSP